MNNTGRRKKETEDEKPKKERKRIKNGGRWKKIRESEK
jgi:hypothetical protein